MGGDGWREEEVGLRLGVEGFGHFVVAIFESSVTKFSDSSYNSDDAYSYRSKSQGHLLGGGSQRTCFPAP